MARLRRLLLASPDGLGHLVRLPAWAGFPCGLPVFACYHSPPPSGWLCAGELPCGVELCHAGVQGVFGGCCGLTCQFLVERGVWRVCSVWSLAGGRLNLRIRLLMRFGLWLALRPGRCVVCGRSPGVGAPVGGVLCGVGVVRWCPCVDGLWGPTSMGCSAVVLQRHGRGVFLMRCV